WGGAVGIATVAAIGVAVLASCTRTPPPTGGTGRYRSQVFNTVQKVANITYATAPGKGGTPETLKLDVYKPGGDTVTKRPLFITAYGGAFIFGSKDGTYDPAYE